MITWCRPSIVGGRWTCEHTGHNGGVCDDCIDGFLKKYHAMLRAARAVDDDAWESNRPHDDKYRVVRVKWLLDLHGAITKAKQ